jgi:DNA-binding transcriptional ArsR family regulator
MQLDELIVDRPEQAKALQSTGFLGHFLKPASPTDVARRLGMSPNLAHHHAKRHAELGLLNLVRREGGKVYYQLAAKTFKHHRSLVPVGDPDEHTATMLACLQERFLAAYERSDRFVSGDDPDWHIYGFDRNTPDPYRDRPPSVPSEAKPAHFQARTLTLSPRRYRDLVRRIAQLIAEAETEGHSSDDACTFAFLASDGTLQDGATESHYLSTFVPLSEPEQEGS